MFKPMFISLITIPMLLAGSITTKAQSSQALNLQHYLNLQTDNEPHITCQEEKIYFNCKVPKYRYQNIDEETNEVLDISGISKAIIHFKKQKLSTLLSEKNMNALYRDMDKEVSPLQEGLDESLAESLSYLYVSNFYSEDKINLTNLTIKEILLLNNLKSSAGSQHYDYPIFGDISLDLKSIKTNEKQYYTFTEELINNIEEQFDKVDQKRKTYVITQLNNISAKEFELPSNLTIKLKNTPANNDKIAIKLMLNMQNSKGTSSEFEVKAMALGASEFLLKQVSNNSESSDLIVQYISLLSTWGSSDTYAKLLKSDIKFKNYIKQYRDKIDELISEETSKSSDKILINIVERLSNSLHHLLDGTSDTLKIELKSKNNSSISKIGQTYMQAVMMAGMNNSKQNDVPSVTSILNKEYLIYIEDSKSLK